MEISVQKSNQLKSIAILMMICLHLFNTDYRGLFQPLLFFGSQPFSYYISLFSQACVPIFAFVSGYGLFYSYVNKRDVYKRRNILRTKKLYLRYWIILILFAVILGWIMRKDGYPGSWQKFLLNFVGAKQSYNGAWWYLAVYVLFVFTSKFWFYLLEKLNPYFYLFCLGFIYAIAFYFRRYNNNIFDNSILDWLHTQTALYFTTLFQFMLGAFTLKYYWDFKISALFKRIRTNNITVLIGIIILIIIRSFFPNAIVAPFFAIVFIFLFLQLNLNGLTDKLLDFFTPHSTNLWLIHMFFSSIYFKNMIFALNIPLLIFLWILFLCIISSFLVNLMYNILSKYLISNFKY